MDNLSELSAMVAPLLSDPEAMNSLRRAAEQMGLGGLLPETPETSDKDRESPHDGSHREDRPPEREQPADVSADMLSAVTRLAPLLASGGEDDTTRLLSALRPFLSQPRAKRLDEAERLLSLGRVLSIIKESKLM